MVGTPVAELIGTPAYADAQDLDRAITHGKKATGAGTAAIIGRVVLLNPATGQYAIAGAGASGTLGVVPRLEPIPQDSLPDVGVVDQTNAEIYVEANGPIKPGQDVVADAGGKVKARAAENPPLVVGRYMGHEGEGSGFQTAATDAIAGDGVRIKLRGVA